MTNSDDIALHERGADEATVRIDDFAATLVAAVAAGANIGFITPLSHDEARRFWRDQAFPAVAGGRRVLWTAERAGRVVGTVQLIVAMPANQPHRCEVTKLIVHPEARRRGVGARLMAALEARARAAAKTLITLDTRTGDDAERLYTRLGFERTGEIPDFCVDPIDGRLHPTTIMFKRLVPRGDVETAAPGSGETDGG